MKKTASTSALRKQCVELAKKIVRSKGRCERCGKTMYLQGSHIKSEGKYRSMSADIDNILCLCVGCHLYWWHKEPLEAAEWFREKYPDRYETLVKRSQVPQKMDWNLKLEELKSRVTE